TSILSTPEIAFRIYPNPSTDGVFHINMEQSAEGEIAVYDMMGKRVLTQKVQAGERRYSINLNRQTPGMYTVVYTSGEAKLVKRVVKGM
ncbi:MAG: T9SS type A sorting domain-containing protein, partial [Bacteroidia bacterium]